MKRQRCLSCQHTYPPEKFLGFDSHGDCLACYHMRHPVSRLDEITSIMHCYIKLKNQNALSLHGCKSMLAAIKNVITLGGEDD